VRLAIPLYHIKNQYSIKKEKQEMNRKAISLVIAVVLSVSAAIPALAGETKGTGGGAAASVNGTEVYAGIVLYDPDARIKVEVPTLFAFVVHGSVSTDANAVTSDNGGILLPNVKVKVNQESGVLPETSNPPTASYSIQTVGDGVMQLTNYSTQAAEMYDSNTETGRIGLAVTVNGNIRNEGDAVSRNYWEHVSKLVGDKSSPKTTEFKKYNISLDGKSLDTPANGGLELAPENVILLDAPINIINGINLDKNTNLANEGIAKTVAFGVAVGGRKDQYKQVEESAKVGTIVWTVSANINRNVYTAPKNDYLDGIGDPKFDNKKVTDPDDIKISQKGTT